MPSPPEGRLPRLYAILDIDSIFARGLQPLAVLGAWLDAGVRLVQLRAKGLALGPMLDLAESVQARCSSAGAMFVVNDRADVARLCSADGVHLGQADLSPAEALSVYPSARVVGLSTHSEAQLGAALESPATYLAMGPVFRTDTKQNPDPVVGLEGIRMASDLIARAAAPRPLVAIGGITAATAATVIEAGADSVAIVSDLLTADPGRRAAACLRALA